ncbi:MAG: DUF5666 domain-containing protein [Terriglobia bacterium]
MAFALVLDIALTTGCGSLDSSVSPPPSPATTSVTVVLSSTANDQLSRFGISLQSLGLTSQSGKTVNLFTASQNNGHNIEFIHLNGSGEPLVTVTVPQDNYTSAVANIGVNAGASAESAAFTCVSVDPTGVVDTNTSAFGYLPSPPTVNVPTPITVNGTAMGLLLEMQVSQSAIFPPLCQVSGTAKYSITPTFNLTPMVFSAQPTNYKNGKETNLDGQVSSVNSGGNSFALVLVDGQTLSVNSKAGTVYQGVDAFSALAAGMFIDMDAAIQSDGSQLATRIAVEDLNPTNLSVATGPVLTSWASEPLVYSFNRQSQGYLTTSGHAANITPYDYSSAVFQISAQFANLQTLPFPARFDAANIFGGQNVYITSHALTFGGFPTYMPATTVTLMPQTINGSVVGVSSSGSFQIYDVALAPYDLPPVLTLQTDIVQSYTLSQPTTVQVYVDTSTQQLNHQALAPGSLLRFSGLLFNDDGTLRMDCGQVNDGVAE